MFSLKNLGQMLINWTHFFQKRPEKKYTNK